MKRPIKSALYVKCTVYRGIHTERTVYEKQTKTKWRPFSLFFVDSLFRVDAPYMSTFIREVNLALTILEYVACLDPQNCWEWDLESAALAAISSKLAK